MKAHLCEMSGQGIKPCLEINGVHQIKANDSIHYEVQANKLAKHKANHHT